MKKRLLFGALLMGSFLTANAQNNCESAVAVTDGSTTVVAAVAGTYGNTCFGGTTNSQGGAIAAEWYSFTAEENGYVTVNAVLAANLVATTDTRLSIFTGTCGTLECYAFNDDNPNPEVNNDFRSVVTFPVEADVTYYIHWDSFWLATGFSFETTFEAAACVSPSEFLFSDPADITTTSATVSWAEAVGAPANYDVMWGNAGFETDDETGTTVSTDTNSAALTDLTEFGNLWYYVRSNCGESQGNWVGPFALTLPAELPFEHDFDDAANRAGGFTNIAGWGFATNEQAGGEVSHSGDGFLFSNLNQIADSDAWLFIKPVVLEAGQSVNLTFFTMVLPQTVDGSIDVTVGTSTVIAEQEVLGSFEVEAGGEYQEFIVNFVAEEAGNYYFGINNNSGASGVGATMFLDSITIVEGAAGTEDVLASKFSVYPNPANNVINIANAENILVNGVVITDLNGRTVKNVSYNGVTEAQINVSELAAGMYMMTVSSDKGTMTKKIVKN